MKYLAKNRKATFEYKIIDKYEAGIVLLGSEVKSIREGSVNFGDAFIDHRQNELFLINSHVSEYKGANQFNHNPQRNRKILLHKREINKIIGKLKTKGITLVPLALYLNAKNKIKIEIAVAEGKKLYDKRKSIQERDWSRQKQRIMKHNI